MKTVLSALRVAVLFAGCGLLISCTAVSNAPTPAASPVRDGIYCKMAKPEFPLESQKAHESGKTKLMFELSPTGNFEHITVVESSGYQRLDDSAIKSVQASHCLPYYKNGKAVSIGVTSAYDFLPVK